MSSIIIIARFMKTACKKLHSADEVAMNSLEGTAIKALVIEFYIPFDIKYAISEMPPQAWCEKKLN